MKRIGIILIGVVLLSACSNSKQKELQAKTNQLKKQMELKMNIGEKNKETVRAFFKAIENENAREIANLFAENGKQVNPYHSDLFPKGAEGKNAIEAYWKPVFPNFDGMTFPIEEIYALEDPNMVYVKYTGNIKLKNNTGVYANNYYSIFRFNEEGKILEYVEIFNPIVAARGFGLIDKIKE